MRTALPFQTGKYRPNWGASRRKTYEERTFVLCRPQHDRRAYREAAGIARRIGARLLHDVREALPPTIFFFVGFNFIVLTMIL